MNIRPARAEPSVFATTHWSVVLLAGQADSPHAAEALEKLCRIYWYPLYVYVRRQGNSPEDAQDLTQDFFSRSWRKTISRGPTATAASSAPSCWGR
jgi:RNA polymerase sigma-70 factor (ECF subfamily)